MKYLKLFSPFVIFGIISFSIILATSEKTYYSKEQDRIEADILTLIVIFILPLILAPFIFQKNFINHYFGFIFFGMVGYFLGNEYRDLKIHKELVLTGTITKGTVTSKRFSKPAKGVGHWEFFCEFEDSIFIYNTFYERDNKNIFTEGDTLDILYLKRNPDISKIIVKIHN